MSIAHPRSFAGWPARSVRHACLAAGLLALCLATPALAATPAFDGTYTGNTRLVVANAASCAPGGPVTVHVRAGRFDYPWQQSQPAAIRITAGGTWSATWPNAPVAADKRLAAWPRIDGVATGDRLSGEYGTRWCAYSYRLDRAP